MSGIGEWSENTKRKIGIAVDLLFYCQQTRLSTALIKVEQRIVRDRLHRLECEIQEGSLQVISINRKCSYSYLQKVRGVGGGTSVFRQS